MVMGIFLYTMNLKSLTILKKKRSLACGYDMIWALESQLYFTNQLCDFFLNLTSLRLSPMFLISKSKLIIAFTL